MGDIYAIDWMTLKRFASRDVNTGAITYTLETVKGKLDRISGFDRNEAGEQVRWSATVFFTPAITVGHNDKISIAGKDYNIVDIKAPTDFTRGSTTIYLE